jgi:hypothetical protein
MVGSTSVQSILTITSSDKLIGVCVFNAHHCNIIPDKYHSVQLDGINVNIANVLFSSPFRKTVSGEGVLGMIENVSLLSTIFIGAKFIAISVINQLLSIIHILKFLVQVQLIQSYSASILKFIGLFLSRLISPNVIVSRTLLILFWLPQYSSPFTNKQN